MLVDERIEWARVLLLFPHALADGCPLIPAISVTKNGASFNPYSIARITSESNSSVPMKTERLENVYLLAKTAAAIALAIFLLSYAAFGTHYTVDNQYTINENSDFPLLRINQNTGQVEFLHQKDGEFVWEDLGSEGNP